MLIETFQNHNHIKFVKCSHFAEDIVNEEELRKRISLFNTKETRIIPPSKA